MVSAVTPLKATEVGDALVLARLGCARFDEAAGRHELQAFLTDSHGSALLARDSVGRACGLMLYRIITLPDQPPTLEVAGLIAFDLMSPQPVAVELIEEAVRLARLQGCRMLRLIRPLDTPAGTLALMLASGAATLHSVF